MDLTQLRRLDHACSRAGLAVLPTGPDFYVSQALLQLCLGRMVRNADIPFCQQYQSGFPGYAQPLGQVQEQLKGLISKCQVATYGRIITSYA